MVEAIVSASELYFALEAFYGTQGILMQTETKMLPRQAASVPGGHYTWIGELCSPRLTVQELPSTILILFSSNNYLSTACLLS